MSAPKGYSSQEKDDRLSAQFQTIEPVRELQYGSSVVAHQFVFEVGTDAAEAGSTSSVIVATGHSALKGDVIRLTSGAFSGREVKVWDVATNSITLAETLPSAVAAAVTFQILRHKYPTVDSSGSVNVNAVIVEEALSPDGGALPAQLKVAGGYDGTNVQVLKTDAAGELQIDVLSSALPSGAATEATLATLATEASLAGLNSIVATETTLNSIDINIGGISNCVSGAELQVDVVTSALPSGAATETTLSTLATEATVATLATEATVSTLATSAKQSDGSQKTQIVDGSGNVIGSTANALDVNLKSPITVDVSLSQANDSVAVFGNDGTTNRALRTDSNGELQIDVISSALPSGAATETTLADVRTSVQLIDDCVGTDGAAAPTKSFVIAGVTSGGLQQTVEVNASGHVNIADGGGSITVDATSWPLPTGAATETTLSALNGKVPANLTVSSTRLLVDGSGVTQPVSIAATVVTQDTGRSVRNRARHVYSSTPVTTAAYQQLLASTSGTINEIEIFDSSGETLVLAIGGIGSEVDQAFVFPGGNGRIPLAIGSGVRVSVKAVSATANAGEIAINFYS